MERLENVRAFLEESGWLTDLMGPNSGTGDGTGDGYAVEFLAAGEYNENWRVDCGGASVVLRINHGSQLGLENQIGYEYKVLQAVAPSGVTPVPLRVESAPTYLSGGALLMSYIEGRHLDYTTDLEGAARAFAAVHSVEMPQNTEDSLTTGGIQLLHQPNPIAAIADESFAMLTKDADHPLQAERTRLLRYHAEIVRLSEDMKTLFAEERMVLANTEVNSSNFLVQEGSHAPNSPHVHIVDWEKAVITPRYQDLGHFLTPTTTLWKTDTVLDAADRQRFLCAYREALCEAQNAAISASIPSSPIPSASIPSLPQLTVLTDALVRTVLLRGLSWCFMAWKEYAGGNRAMVHEHTRKTIQRYLSDIDFFLKV